jgi:hypothetical protein
MNLRRRYQLWRIRRRQKRLWFHIRNNSSSEEVETARQSGIREGLEMAAKYLEAEFDARGGIRLYAFTTNAAEAIRALVEGPEGKEGGDDSEE